MVTDEKLEQYKKEEAKNRKEGRDLIRKQGWYYRVVVPTNDTNNWLIFKIKRQGKSFKSELFDKKENYMTGGNING